MPFLHLSEDKKDRLSSPYTVLKNEFIRVSDTER